MKIAVLGPKGTFSDKAGSEYKKKNSLDIADSMTGLESVYCQTIDDVFEAVCPKEGSSEKDICELGIVPIENTLDGYVQRTLDLLLEKDVYIMDENLVSVQFALVGNCENLNEVNKLYVQFKANGQCRQFINSLKNVDIITTQSNMDSYYKIKDTKGTAAIVPKHIAVNEGSRFVIDNVTDADNNHTRFVIFRRGNLKVNEFCQSNLSSKTDKKVRIPVCIMPNTDRPGILFEILKCFHDKQINLISIMSRPTKQIMGTYNFYIEIDGLYEELNVILEALSQIRRYNDIKILGIYDE